MRSKDIERDDVWKRAREKAIEAGSKAGGKWLSERGHTHRFGDMTPSDWLAFIAAVTDEHAATFEEVAERLCIQAADEETDDRPF